jgi:chemotaxis protein methyltransferase CheR
MSTVTATGLDSSTFQYVQELVQRRSAIALECGKDYLVESRLLPLARAQGLGSVEELVRRLKSQPEGPLHAQVVEAMTTNETSFFRDVHPFEALRTVVLPELIAARASQRKLRIWSAACSTGQELYSLAILLAEHFPQLERWDVELFGSDLAQGVLEKAAAGVYSQLEVNRGLPATLLVKYFDKEVLVWRVKESLRQKVKFLRINLIEPWPPLPVMDVIFLRNVLIYFPSPVKQQILRKMRQRLAPDGALFLGGAETTLGLDDAWQRIPCGKSAFYRHAPAMADPAMPGARR